MEKVRLKNCSKARYLTQYFLELFMAMAGKKKLPEVGGEKKIMNQDAQEAKKRVEDFRSLFRFTARVYFIFPHHFASWAS